ncbi:MAG: hypothetical protein HQK52_07950 [Oligoflexia bacterium]|nr:hypothetical protein [Oligoflexia bacterium]
MTQEIKPKDSQMIFFLPNNYKTQKTIIFDAEPFCFGPISTTLSLAKELRKKVDPQYRFVLLGTLTSLQLGQKSNLFDEVIECNTTSTEELSQHRSLIENCSLYISNTNPNSIKYLQDIPIKKIYIDTLFWMWDKLLADFNTVDTYYIQDFFGTKEALEKFSEKVNNPKVVPPLIPIDMPNPQPELSENKRPINLITFGGIDNIYSKTSKFCQCFMNSLVTHKDFSKHEFIVAGGGNTIEFLKNNYSGFKNLTIDVFDKFEFLSLMASADKVIAGSGITTFYEMCYYEKDVFFLPPQNYSQALQLRIYQDNLDQINFFNWESNRGYPLIPEGLPEMEGIAKNSECLEFFLNSTDEQDRLIQDVFDFIYSSPSKLTQDHFSIKNSGVVNIVDDIVNDLK